MTDGNTLLSNEEVEMLTVLRMNEDFMEYMRARRPKLSQQRLNQTRLCLVISDGCLRFCATSGQPAPITAWRRRGEL